MSESEKKLKYEFLVKFSKSNSITVFRKLCSKVLKKSRCAFLDSDYKPVNCVARKECNHLRLGKYLARLKSGPLREYMVFKCSCDRVCLSFPVIQGSSIYGHVLFIHLKKEPRKNIIDAVRIFMDLALKEFQKEQELTRLYETIRPRAIALSTIHTIHRLLSSTLNMDELIERIARLTLQVMRSRHCSIMLLDESRKYLIPKAIINLDKEIPKTDSQYKKIKLGVKMEGKVAKTGKAVFGRNAVCVPLVEEDVIGVISARDKTNDAPFDKFELEILITLAEQAVIAVKNAQMYEEQEKMAYGSIKTLAALLDSKSPNTFTHSDQFVKMVLTLAEAMKLPREDIANLHYAALLPDTGKFSIPDEILKKPGSLSSKEYDIIKKQHLESLKIIEHLEFLKPAMPIIRHHHERYDGAGYPDGLKGSSIPPGARIMAVANAFEAMISARPYKGKKISISQAIKEIEKNKGTQFDPETVDAFIAATNNPEFENIVRL